MTLSLPSLQSQNVLKQILKIQPERTHSVGKHKEQLEITHLIIGTNNYLGKSFNIICNSEKPRDRPTHPMSINSAMENSCFNNIVEFCAAMKMKLLLLLHTTNQFSPYDAG